MKAQPGNATVPWIFIWFRGLCGFAPWLCAVFDWPLTIAAALIPLALLSDIFDGIIARANNAASELLRRADGWADLVFVLSYTGFALIFRHDALAPYMPWVVALGVYKALGTAHDLLRYGRGAAFHFWSAKLWALPYYGLLFELMIDHRALWMIWPTLVMGAIAITEEFIAVRLIPVWMHDQPNIFAALRAYREKEESAGKQTMKVD